jgi:dynactin 5
MAAVETSASSNSPVVDSETEESSSYIQTTTNNYVSRKAFIDGSKHVELKGRSVVSDGVRIHGDLGLVRIGRYCHIHSNTTLQPPPLPGQEENKFVPVTVGSHTVIGKDCVLEAAAIGSLCWIGDGVKIGQRCILKDCCVVADGTVIPADTVIPPFTRVFSSANGRLVTTELPPSVAVELQERALESYQEFAAMQRRQQQPKR